MEFLLGGSTGQQLKDNEVLHHQTHPISTRSSSTTNAAPEGFIPTEVSSPWKTFSPWRILSPPEGFIPPQMIFFPKGDIRKQLAFLSIHPKLWSHRSRGGRRYSYPHLPLLPKDMRRQMTGNGDSKIDPLMSNPWGITSSRIKNKKHGAGLLLLTVCSEHPSEGKLTVVSMKLFPVCSLCSWHKNIKREKILWMY